MNLDDLTMPERLLFHNNKSFYLDLGKSEEEANQKAWESIKSLKEMPQERH